MTKEQAILAEARQVAASAKTWIDLSNALFDPASGLVATAFPTRQERAQFLSTEEYRAIRQLIAAARERADPPLSSASDLNR